MDGTGDHHVKRSKTTPQKLTVCFLSSAESTVGNGTKKQKDYWECGRGKEKVREG
jgi:hypothetical protein